MNINLQNQNQQPKTKTLEIPYNFDKQLIDFLYMLDDTGSVYHSIYCCPHKDDYISAKYYHHASYGLDMLKANDMTKQEYISHIQNIEKKFPKKLMLLLQQNDYCMPLDKLSFYLALGFTKFCVGSLEQAKQIKEINSEYEVIGSITMKVSITQLNDPEYQKYFDGFVLWFPYNRNFEILPSLPKCFEYTMLVNCDCNIKCDGTHHWFANRTTEKAKPEGFCPNSAYKGGPQDWNYSIRIRPVDLPAFMPYITHFKLQGREHLTRAIMMDVCTYLGNYDQYPGLQPDPSWYMASNRKKKTENG